MLFDTANREENALRTAFLKVAKPVGLVMAAVPLAGALMAGLGYATKTPADPNEKFIDTAQTDYSKQLESLRQEYMRKSEGKIQIAMIDPDQFHLMIALGKSPSAAVNILAHHQGIQLDSQQVDQAAMESGHFMRYFDERMSNTLGVTQRNGFAPMAVMDGDTSTCAYLPYEFRSDLLEQPKGWTAPQVAEFVSRHELTHCLDERYRLEEDNAKTPGAKFAASMKREMLGDVSAFGEMIAKGGDPSMIDGILQERRMVRDEHFDVAGLINLQQRLQFGGLVAFRNLDERQRDQFYHDVVDRSSLDADNAEAFQKLESGSLTMAVVKKDPHLVAAMRLYEQRGPEENPTSPKYTKAEAAEVNSYDPLRALSSAGDTEAKVKLRAQMLDDLRQEPTSSKIYLAKIEKLNQAFESQVQPVHTTPRYAAVKSPKSKPTV